ncbi:hypothetical protein H0H81_011573 [Sphagnurus paluster]|uniref:MutL C-terminal dimerisation domain-containing protein n=1 Tax=Sphagnurus paluster TaxID=117069 RepID=A0A9P7KLE5_9AGAR|nr:hypothetical protein H0H81_011573 [Sphagnurus paluster]
MHQAAIEKLDVPTRVKLRSTQILTSLPQLVSELVQNSLDAGATNVDIGVHCEDWMCWVKDNGFGIRKEGLSFLGTGSEYARYGSSKPYQADTLNTLSTFGFRGEALASAADLACLEISSRTANSRETWSVITKGGKNLYEGPAVRWRRESSGTVVCIRDAFYNLPVRRLSHPSPARTLELIRQELETYALVFPSVAFTMENLHNETGPPKGRILRIAKVIPALDEIGEMDLPRSTTRRSPRKIEKRPVYVLNLTVPPAEIDNCLEPSKAHIQFRHRAIVETLLSSSIESFLLRHGFLICGVSKSRSGNDRGSPSPRKRRKLAIFEDDSGYGEVFDVPFRAESPAKNTRKLKVELFSISVGNADASEIAWTDPSTGETFTVDPRTGNSHPQAEPPPRTTDTSSKINYSRRRTIPSSKATIPETNLDDGPSVPVWLLKALKANKAYEPAENPITKLTSSAIATLPLPSGNPLDACADHETSLCDPFSTAVDTHQHRFVKEDIRRAKVISQVDRKFIACLMEEQSNTQPQLSRPKNAGPSLVLIDQHAADERVRVERFLKDLCLGYLRNQHGLWASGIQVKELLPPLPLLLTLHETQILRGSEQIRQSFREWGFHLDFLDDQYEANDASDAGEDSGYAQVIVKSVPEVVKDKVEFYIIPLYTS